MPSAAGEEGVVGQRVADLAGGLARGRPERGRVEADDERLVRAGAACLFVVVATAVLYTLSLHDALPIYVAAGLGGAVGAVVGAVARDRNPGGAVDGRAQVGAVVARLEQVEADRAAGIRGGQGEAGVVGQRVADLAGGLARGRPERGRVERVEVGVGGGDVLAFLEVDRDAPVGHRLAPAVRATHATGQAVERPMGWKRALVHGVGREVRDVVEVLVACAAHRRDAEVGQRERARRVAERAIPTGRVFHDVDESGEGDRVLRERTVLVAAGAVEIDQTRVVRRAGE